MAFAPLFIWIGVIFYLSSSSGSMTETSRFIGPMLEFLFPNSSAEMLVTYHFYIRKLAHLTVYAVLGFFAVRAILRSLGFKRSKIAVAVALMVVFLVAVADETNQSFNSLRTSSAGDVLLDCIGGLFAISIYLATRFYFAKLISPNHQSNP